MLYINNLFMNNIEEISKKFTPIYFFGVIFIVLMFYVMFNGYVANDNVKYLKEKISTIQDNVDSIYKKNEQIEKKFDGFNKEIKKIDNHITNNNIKIDNLKNYEKEKQDSFNSYDSNMWERFFADRYKEQE